MDQFFQYMLAFLAAFCIGYIVTIGIRKLRAERARKARLEYFRRRYPAEDGFDHNKPPFEG